MDKEFNAQLLTYLNDTAAFAKEQLPDVANQIILWGIVGNLILFLCSAIFTAFAFKKSKPLEGENFLKEVALPIGGVVSAIICVFALYDMLQAIIAPKLYIINYLT